MIAKDEIENILQIIDQKYQDSQSGDVDFLRLLSKLAVIELSGWLEVTFDKFGQSVCSSIDTEGSGKEVLDLLNKKIGRVNGFLYEEHLKDILIYAIGVRDFFKIERRLKNQGQGERFTAALSNLNKARNSAAHTHLYGATKSFDSPSITISVLQNLMPFLIQLSSELDAHPPTTDN